MDKLPKDSRMNLIPKSIRRDLQHILGRLGLPKDTKPLYVGTQNSIQTTEPTINDVTVPSRYSNGEEQRLLEES